MSNIRWSVMVPEDTERALRSYLTRTGGKKGDLSRFVDDAVLARLKVFCSAEHRTVDRHLTVTRVFHLKLTIDIYLETLFKVATIGISKSKRIP